MGSKIPATSPRQKAKARGLKVHFFISLHYPYYGTLLDNMKQINISYGGIIIIIHSTTLGSLAFPEESEMVDGEGKGEIDVCVRSRAVTIPLLLDPDP